MFDIGTDPEAFEAFYRRHFDEVTRVLARRVADPHQVADRVRLHRARRSLRQVPGVVPPRLMEGIQ